MKNRLQALILGGALLAGASVPAVARDNVSFSLSFGVPAYTYYAPPPPVYYAPPPPVAYYRPAPAPVYYYGAPAVGFAVHSGHGRGHGHRHHHRHHHR